MEKLHGKNSVRALFLFFFPLIILDSLPHFHSLPGVGVFWVITINSKLVFRITNVN